MGASSCGAAFPDGVVRTCARQGARARDGAEEKIVALGAGMGERTRSCFRSEHEAGGAHARCPRERRCRTWDTATVARAAALRAPHRGDGAGARAVEAEMVAALRRGNGGDGTGDRGARARPSFTVWILDIRLRWRSSQSDSGTSLGDLSGSTSEGGEL